MIYPLFVAAGNRFGGQRLSRRGIRWLVDQYLEAAGLKHANGKTLSAHSLRPTAGTLGLRGGADLRQLSKNIRKNLGSGKPWNGFFAGSAVELTGIILTVAFLS